MKISLSEKISLLSLFIIIIGGVYFAYIKYYPFNVLEINNLPYPVLNSPVQSGDQLQYKIDVCKNRALVARVSPQIVGDVVIALDSYHSNVEAGCNITVIGNVVIPEFTPSGTYYAKITITYAIHPWRDVTYVAYTENFEVINIK